MEKATPIGYDQNAHLFELSNFNSAIVKCWYCKRVLYGILFQGYICKKCNCICHKRCLTNVKECLMGFRNGLLSLTHAPSSLLLEKQIDFQKSIEHLQKSMSIDKAAANKTPSNEILLREYSMNFGDVEKNSNTESIDSQLAYLQAEPYYAAVSRDLAELILKRIDEKITKILFLVRPSNKTQFALTLRYLSGDIKHIRINTISNISSTATIMVWLTPGKKFTSVPKLVEHYRHNSLAEAFKHLPVKLECSYKDALPTPVCYANVIFDYHSIGELDLSLKKGDVVGVYSQNVRKGDMCHVVNKLGLRGYVPSSYLQNSP